MTGNAKNAAQAQQPSRDMTLQGYDFRGATVFVSGGTSGINLGIAEAYAAAGAKVAVMSRNVDRVEAAAAQLRRHGGEALGFVGDVRDMEAVRRSLAGAHAKFGEIDVLVSGAAGNFLAPALDISSNGFPCGGRYRSGWHISRAASRLRFPATPGRVADQHIGSAVDVSVTDAGPCLCRQGRPRSGHARACP